MGAPGFAVPLLAVLGAELLVGALMLGPSALSRPAVTLARATYDPYGATITYTVITVLVVLLLTPAYDLYSLQRASHATTEAEAYQLGTREAQAQLLLALTGSALAGLLLLRRLGRVLGDLERAALSELALLKQVKGLQAEYSRLLDSAAPSGASRAGGSAPAAQLEARVAAAEKAQRAAEANLSAFKTQAKGLQNEYDRLAVESEELRRQLRRAGPGSTGGGGGAGGGAAKKDD